MTLITLPRLIALTKIVMASMKMIIEALPTTAIIFRTTCWPVKAAIVATRTKKEAAERERQRTRSF